MSDHPASPSARQVELLEAAYRYALEHGLADLSLRPLAAAIGSSPRVLIFLFGSKDGLVRALLARARVDELAVLAGPGPDTESGEAAGLVPAAEEIWAWLREARHRPLLRLWAEAYTRSLIEPDGAWAGFAASTVTDWLGLLASCQPRHERDTADGTAARTAVLALLRGCLLDLLATGDLDRVDAALHHQLGLIRNGPVR
ncbi:TetR/AcrR family transcriptional regulator [Actinoplanes sp. CA-252034]|uniref:TetR/AcrR family transcriptional regulator n=1 Tax=Actinoplanes sp. CA-252034 TaxID=3239906 RepID=UPI003D95BC6C